MFRILLCCLVLAVTACAAEPAETPTVDVAAAPAPSDRPPLVVYEQDVEPPPERSPPVAAIAETAGAIVAAMPLPDPVVPPPAPEPLVCDQAIDLIIAFEVGSPEIYTRKYTRPIWPGAASGVTVGLGYDLGYRAPRVIALDWEDHPHHVRLQTASGIRGPIAREMARHLADISVEYGLARQVFDQTSLVEHYHQAERAYGDGFKRAPPCVRGGVTSVVFNRGSSLTGGRRVEMRAIRTCLAADDYRCVATQIRNMTRLWVDTDIEEGMRRRREAEARLVESVL